MKYSNRSHLLFSLLSIVLLFAGCARMPGSTSAPNTSNKTALRIHRVLPQYAEKSNESWPVIAANTPIKMGQSNPVVPVIRHRLIVLKDLSNVHASDSTHYDAPMVEAIRGFQWRHGIVSNGVIDQKTLSALNVSPRQRYQELVASMNEWAQLPEDETSRYIHVNIPSFHMYLIDRGQQVMDMKVVAGRADRPTPTLYSKVKTIVFNPQWNVPKTILTHDVIPGMRKNPNYMKEHYNMKLYSSWDKNAAQIDPLTVDWNNANGSNFKYRITAPPGDENPLGRVKFIFENSEDIYMHGTPAKGLFASIERAYSSGCIRLENPFHLVEYFYADNQDLDHAQVNQYLSTNQTKYIQLKNPIPIYITYITAWVDANGKVHFRENIYQRS